VLFFAVLWGTKSDLVFVWIVDVAVGCDRRRLSLFVAVLSLFEHTSLLRLEHPNIIPSKEASKQEQNERREACRSVAGFECDDGRPKKSSG